MYTPVLYDVPTVIQFMFAAFILGYTLATMWIMGVLRIFGHGL